MSVKLVVKHHEQFGKIRVVIKNDEPWFVAKDVCEVLGIADTSQAVKALNEDEKGTCKIRTPGGPQKLSIISESGFYHILSRSNKPEAKNFSRWVRKDVLPSIRKKGYYAESGLTQLQALQQSEEMAW